MLQQYIGNDRTWLALKRTKEPAPGGRSRRQPWLAGLPLQTRCHAYSKQCDQKTPGADLRGSVTRFTRHPFVLVFLLGVAENCQRHLSRAQ